MQIAFELANWEDVVPRHLLTAKEIIAARDCDLVDGDGLTIRVKGPSATAVLRFTSPIRGSRREMGLAGSDARASQPPANRSLRCAAPPRTRGITYR
jgi:hypothetical protein